VTKISTSHRFF